MRSFGSILVLLSIAARTQAFDNWQSTVLDYNDPEERSLFAFVRGNRLCQRRLERCEAGTGGDELPVASWIESLGGLDQEDETVQKTVALLEAIGTADATEDMENAAKKQYTLQYFGAVKALKDIETKAEEFSYDPAQKPTPLFVFILRMFVQFIGVGPLSWLPFVYQFVELILLIILAAVQGNGPLSILEAVFNLIITIIIVSVRESNRVLKTPFPDVDCFAAVVNCKNREAMNELVPLVIGLLLEPEEASP